MKKILSQFLTLTFPLFLLMACEPAPQAIRYGDEACAYCRMSIVDERYAAQLVASTGKAYSFDAMECMIHYQHEHPRQEWAHEMVCDYSNPGAMIPATSATVLRSRQLPSPMGMYLTAVSSRKQAEKLQDQFEGEIYPYATVANDLDNLPAL